MQPLIPMPTKRYKAFCIYGGSGLGALGLQWAKARFGDMQGEFEVLGSVDVDANACQDFEAFTGVKSTPLDLFDEGQYKDWNGKAPPSDWQEATCDDLLAAAQGQDPELVLVTAPCKGLSGLLSQEKSDSVRYQALNRLTYRGVFMVLETWKHNLPGLIMFENVPRIATRGKKFLNEIKALLRAYGYVFDPDKDEHHHDLGPIGGLGQHRRRYLLVARQPSKVTSFLYYPPKLRMKSIGDVMEQQVPWMPDDPAAGPMHRLPRLQWKTWVRLALIPPGGDWRDLQNIKPGQYRITAEMNGEHTSKYRVYDSTLPAGTVTGSDRLGSGAPSVADPRIDETADQYKNTYRVGDWDKPSGTVVTGLSPSNGAGVVADPRIGHTPMGNGKGAFWVQDSSDPSGTITADPGHRKSGGASVVADPRLGHEARDASMRVGDWNDPSGPVTGSAAVTSSNGIGAVADPRRLREARPGCMQVGDWNEPSGAVTGSASASNSNGIGAVADPRTHMMHTADGRYDCFHNVHRVRPWDEPTGAVTASGSSAKDAAMVADPRISETPRFNNVQRVIDFDEPSVAVTAAAATSNAAGVVADPRFTREPRAGVLDVQEWDNSGHTVTGGKDPNGTMASISDPRSLEHASTYGNMLPVTDWEESANTVTGAAGPNQGASLVADPRLGCIPRGNTKGPLGVQPWDDTGVTVIGSNDVHAGAAAVADPRDHQGEQPTRIPADDERGVWFIRSPHKDKKGRHCIHRPMTTMELLALQSVPVMRADGSPVVLTGNSDRSWRERIGNGLPPAAMKAIGEMALFSLLPSEEGSWILSPFGTPVWVRGSDGTPVYWSAPWETES